MRFDGVNDKSVVAQRAQEVVEAMEAGEEVARVSEPLAVKVRVNEIIAAGELDKAMEEKLRKARIVTLMAAEDPEVAVEGIKLSQKENGIGNAPPIMQQFNLGEPPPKMARLMEEVEADES